MLRRASIALSDSASILSSTVSNNDDDDDDQSNIARLSAEIDNAVESVVEKIQKEKDDIEQKFLTPDLIRTRDKMTFVVSLLSLVALGMLLGHSPQAYYKVNAILILTTVTVRTIRYRLKRWHWYLLDFCYLVNALLICWCFVTPFRETLIKWNLPVFRVLYAFAHGPLAIAILLFRNSFVLHSLDRTTSVLIHFSPCLCVYTLRWYGGGGAGAGAGAGAGSGSAETTSHLYDSSSSSTTHTMVDVLSLQFALWFVWAFLYYLKCFVLDKKKAIDKNYETLFVFVKNSSGPLTEWIKRGKGHTLLNPYVRYMTLHCCLMLFSTTLSILWWNYYYLNTAYLLVIVIGAFWNGAGYYFVWFTRKYEKSVEKYDRKSEKVKVK